MPLEVRKQCVGCGGDWSKCAVEWNALDDWWRCGCGTSNEPTPVSAQATGPGKETP